MDIASKVELLKKVDFISLIPDSTIEKLAQTTREITVDLDETIIQEGDSGDTMYIVLSGELEIYKKNKVLADRVPGQYFGEMALIESKPRSASIRAIKKSLLLEITKEQFQEYFATNPSSLMALLKALSDRSRQDLNTLDIGYEKLKQEENLSTQLRQILDDTFNEIFVITPTTYDFVLLNGRARENLGYEGPEVKELNYMDIVENLDAEKFKKLAEPLIAGKTTLVDYETFHKRKNGSVYPVKAHLQLSRNEGIPLLVAIIEDVTDKKEMEDRIKQMAFYDSLTHLPNRNLLNDRMGMALVQAERNKTQVAVLLVDMDNFKTVNDTFGHHIGDLLLYEIAKRLKAELRKEDTIGRLGGDEFVILLTGIKSVKHVSILTQKICDNLKPEYVLGPHKVKSRFSIGIALFPDSGTDASVLLERADQAMYRAKKVEGNSFSLYHEGMAFKGDSNDKKEETLRLALERNEFLLHYQPIVDWDNEKIIGIEALVRWQQPDVGLTYPLDFMPLIEKLSLDFSLGEWVLQTACKQLREWEQMGLPSFRIMVNLSANQFSNDDIIKVTKDALKKNKVVPDQLELEIRENILMPENADILSRLRKLNALGIRLSVDDFCTGYSSLPFLKGLPINSLKIDPVFIHDYKQTSNATILKAIVSMAKTMNLQIIPEGVETIEQCEFLKSIGCNLIQGILACEPQSASKITELLQKGWKPPPLKIPSKNKG